MTFSILFLINNHRSIDMIIEQADYKRNKNGEIESMGGAEFKFIPMLNVIRYDEGKTFLDKIDEVNKSGSGTDLKALIRN